MLFPLIAITTGLPLIGWAKPVPVDIRHLRRRERDFALDRRGRAGQQRPDGRRWARSLLVVIPASAGDVAGRAVLRRASS